MSMVPLGEFMPSRIPSVNPAKHPDEVFELWSIPAFDEGKPEVVPGSEIGSSKKCVEPGDVLLSRIVPHIRRSWVVSPATENRQIASGEWITFRSDEFDGRYMRHMLTSDPFHVEFMKTVAGVGGSLLRARPEGVKQIKIPLPPLEEQRRIAGILDQADALRRLRTRALDKLNTLGQAIFHEMFGAALANQFFEFGKAVEEFRYGTSNKSGEGGLPALRIPNVIGGGIDTGEIKTVEVTGAELDRLRLQEGDVLFVRTNGNPDYVGRCASFSQDAVAGYGVETDWIFASYLIRARLSDRINPVFAKTYFASQIGRKAIRERCKTSAGQFNINTEGLSSLPFPDVSREQQDRFAQTVAAIEKNSAPMKASAEAMERKFSSLQYSAFRGEL